MHMSGQLHAIFDDILLSPPFLRVDRKDVK
jgi:hypothetical protein